MFKKIARFIHDLKVFFLAVIFLSFLSILGANPIDIGRFVGANFTKAIGMSVGVPENPFNKLAAQLRDKEEKLALKEEDLSKREEALGVVNNKQDRSITFLLIGVFMLFVLVVTNFAMDFRRRRA